LGAGEQDAARVFLRKLWYGEKYFPLAFSSFGIMLFTEQAENARRGFADRKAAQAALPCGFAPVQR
jgi:hypothetical protein